MWSAHSNHRRTRLAARGKEELLVAAARIIAQRGLDQTRFSDVADESGVSISALQYYFGSREDLLFAAIQYAVQEEIHRLRNIATQCTSPRERLIRLIGFALGEDNDLQESRRVRSEIYHAALHNAEVRAIYLQVYEAWLAVFREAIKDGIQQQVFHQGISSYDVAMQILAVVEGFSAPILNEYPALDPVKAQHLSAEVVVSMLKIDQPLSGTA